MIESPLDQPVQLAPTVPVEVPAEVPVEDWEDCVYEIEVIETPELECWPEEAIPVEDVQRFSISFDDAALRYEPGDGSLQISTQSNVLSYGGDWEVVQIEPSVYAFRQQIWKNFYWQVDTISKQVTEITNGSFGESGGDEKVLNVVVDTVGSDQNPDWFYLRFNDAYLNRSQKNNTVTIAAAQGTVLSYGWDWSVVELSPYLFQLKQNNWQSFYWEVNTSDPFAYRVEGGTFGQSNGGSWEDLDVTVDVVY